MNPSKVGDIITLSDEVTLKDELLAKRGVKGTEWTVTSKRIIAAPKSIFNYTIYQLEAEDKKRFLLFKQVDAAMDIRVYQFNGWLNPGTREDYLRDAAALFEAGKPDEFAQQINLMIAGQDCVFFKKYPTVFGETIEQPKRTGLTYPLFTGITEYISDAPIDCKEILILETAGWIEFLEGWAIDASDFEVMAV